MYRMYPVDSGEGSRAPAPFECVQLSLHGNYYGNSQGDVLSTVLTAHLPPSVAGMF